MFIQASTRSIFFRILVTREALCFMFLSALFHCFFLLLINNKLTLVKHFSIYKVQSMAILIIFGLLFMHNAQCNSSSLISRLRLLQLGNWSQAPTLRFLL